MNTTTSPPLASSWLIPLLFTLVLVGVLAWTFTDLKSSGGPLVGISFEAGHGLQPDNDVKCRGITVGRVRSLELRDQGVHAVVELAEPAAEQLAREGSRWWIVRPKVELSGVQGMDALLGPRWIQVDPSPDESPACYEYAGLKEPPIIESISPGDLKISLLAQERGSLHPGSSVLFRGVPIGTVLSIDLSDDATSVCAEAVVRAPFVSLVRMNSRFYQTGAFDLDIGLGGINARLDSLETLIIGGVTLVTPDTPGEPVKSGHRFDVAGEADSDWFDWRPEITLDR